MAVATGVVAFFAYPAVGADGNVPAEFGGSAFFDGGQGT